MLPVLYKQFGVYLFVSHLEVYVLANLSIISLIVNVAWGIIAHFVFKLEFA